jgi:hypothetical protein
MEKTFQTLRSACAIESKPATSWALPRAWGRLIQWAAAAADDAVQVSSGTAKPVAMLWHVLETMDWKRLPTGEGFGAQGQSKTLQPCGLDPLPSQKNADPSNFQAVPTLRSCKLRLAVPCE